MIQTAAEFGGFGLCGPESVWPCMTTTAPMPPPTTSSVIRQQQMNSIEPLVDAVPTSSSSAGAAAAPPTAFQPSALPPFIRYSAFSPFGG